MNWILIRHGMTQGNAEKRYVGCRTDEPLCAEGIVQLRQNAYPAVRHVYCSPMRRCLETAELLYPEIRPEIIADFRECDFGAFEYHNFAELNGRKDYQDWIDSGGDIPFPDGESRAGFSARCLKAFETLKSRTPQTDCALIVHGGTIMAIMEAMAEPKGNYFDFQIRNGCGYLLREDGTYTVIPAPRFQSGSGASDPDQSF